MTTEYSKVFEQLVNTESEDQDLIGLLAYALYKQKKRDWVIRLKEKGTPPDEAAERSFEETHGQRDFDFFRGQAKDLLLAFSDSVVDDATPTIREEALQHRILNDANTVLLDAKRQNNPLAIMWGGFLGSLFFSVIVAAIAFVITNSGSDLFNALAAPKVVPAQTQVQQK